jgi:hypothetical protein
MTAKGQTQTRYSENCQNARNEHADALAKKGAKIIQMHTRETAYRSSTLHLKQAFQTS